MSQLFFVCIRRNYTIFFLLVTYFMSIGLFVKNIHAIQCVDEDNNPVDWIVAYKLPAIRHENNFIANGLAYIYMTSTNYSDWTLSNIPINKTNSLIANTISKLYSPSQKEDFFILYNDETPNCEKTSEKGHNKGVVLGNDKGGLWFIHSVPKFPSLDSYKYPKTGLKFGQSFLCISLDLENLDKVGVQLQYNEPEIYAQSIPSSLKTALPNLMAAAANVTVHKMPWYHQIEINSLLGTNFVSFAKSKNFGKDLYEDWVAPALQSSLLVETWPDGPGRLNSDCSKPFKVKNVESIFIPKSNLTFSSTHDHSKWAVSSPGNGASWICIGDINRAEHQEKRGGGTLCLQNKKLSGDYQKLVKSVEECK